jgi:hypothetical protein
MMSEVRAERTDLDIADDIERIIAHYPPLTNDRHYLDITVQYGAVTASGHTRTSITRRYLVNALGQIPDVVRVEADGLYCDDHIRLEIARLIPVGVIANVMYGTVILTGTLPEGGNEAELVALVDNVPGVRAVRTQFA